jgi:hypothetical protein
MSDEICKTCNKPHGNGWNPIHPFNDGSAGATAFLGKRGHRAPIPAPNDAQRASETPFRPVFPSDPVLRVALLAAGVITEKQLRDAEDNLTIAFDQLERGTRGESTEGPRRGEVQVGEAAPVDVGEQPVRSQEVGAQSDHQQG